MHQLSSEDLQEIYKWVDTIPLSRVKKNIARDFSDGVLISEVVHHFFPKLIELHNYSSTNSISQKAYNWRTINQKVFRKIGFQISEQDVNDIVTCKRGATERVLKLCKINFVKYQKKRQQKRNSLQQRKIKNNNNQQKLISNNNNNNHSNNYDSMSPNNDNNTDRNNNIENEIPSSTSKQIIQEKDRIIQHLNDKMEILELKVQKLEQLLRLKDAKIETLNNRLN